MKTRTSKQKIWLSCILLLPLFALTLYGFSDKKEVLKSLEEFQEPIQKHTARSISIEILEDGTYEIDGISATKNTLVNEVNKLHQDITPEIRNNIMNIHVTSSTEISNEETWFLYNALLDYGFYRLVTPEQEVVKGKGNTPFANEKNQQKVTKEEVDAYNTWAIKIHNESTIISKNATLLPIVDEQEMIKFSEIYNRMSPQQKDQSVKFPFPDLNIKENEQNYGKGHAAFAIEQNQEKATPQEIEEYNKLASQHNDKPENLRIIKQKDFERMEYLYKKMSEEQKANAEPFPNFPPPPPPPATKIPSSTSEKSNKQSESQRKSSSPWQLGETTLIETYEVDTNENNSKDYVSRQLMLRMSEKQTKPLNYMLNNKKSSYLEVKSFVKTFEDCDVSFKAGDINILSFSKRNGNKMSEEELQRIYSKLFENFDQDPTKTTLIAKQVPEKTMQQTAPLDFVIEMAKKDAKFYYEDKSISSDDAIKLLKENKQLNIATKQSDSKEPKVYISKEPIVFKQHAKTKEQVMINGKSSKDGYFSFTGPELSDIELSIAAGTITEFKFKVPGKPTLFIKGNRLNDDAKSQIKETAIGSGAQLLDIKNSINEVHPPIFVEIK